MTELNIEHYDYDGTITAHNYTMPIAGLPFKPVLNYSNSYRCWEWPDSCFQPLQTLMIRLRNIGRCWEPL